MFTMYIFKADIAFSDHTFLGRKTVQLKNHKKASAEEAVNSNFLSLMSEHMLKRIKPFRLVYPKPGLHDLRLSDGELQNHRGPK